MQQLPVRRPETQLEHDVTAGGTLPINRESLENTSLEPLVDQGCCVYLVFSTTVNVTGCYRMSRTFGMINSLQQHEMKHG